MAHELYFLSILQEALRQPNPKRNLHQAFQQIERLGQQEEYRIGYQQFVRFLQEIDQHRQHEGVESLSLDDQLLQQILPLIPNQLEAIVREIVPDQVESHTIPEPALELYKGKQFIATQTFALTEAIITFTRLLPGNYTLQWETGWVLLKMELLPEHLLFSEETDQPIPFAAETEYAQPEPSRSWTLLQGELQVSIFPGFESGTMVIQRG